MNTTTLVETKITFPGIHYWAEAPEGVSYLRSPHRHVFVVRARKRVSHADRETEFILLGQAILSYVNAEFQHLTRSAEAPLLLKSMSCEQLARLILERFDLDEVSVHEDDENGAICAATAQESDHVDHHQAV